MQAAQRKRWRPEQAMAKKPTSDKSDGRMTLEPLTDDRSGTARFGPRRSSTRNEVDRRTRTERRLVYDRRELIRFEDDRRANRDRRIGNDPWTIP